MKQKYLVWTNCLWIIISLVCLPLFCVFFTDNWRVYTPVALKTLSILGNTIWIFSIVLLLWLLNCVFLIFWKKQNEKFSNWLKITFTGLSLISCWVIGLILVINLMNHFLLFPSFTVLPGRIILPNNQFNWLDWQNYFQSNAASIFLQLFNQHLKPFNDFGSYSEQTQVFHRNLMSFFNRVVELKVETWNKHSGQFIFLQQITVHFQFQIRFHEVSQTILTGNQPGQLITYRVNFWNLLNGQPASKGTMYLQMIWNQN